MQTIMKQSPLSFLRLGVLSLLLTLALALGACDTEEGGISDRKGASMAENAGQGPENEEDSQGNQDAQDSEAGEDN